MPKGPPRPTAYQLEVRAAVIVNLERRLEAAGEEPLHSPGHALHAAAVENA